MGKQYDLVWKNCVFWCHKHNKCANEITEKELMSYLFYIFKKGKAYSTVNTHKVGLLKLYLCDNKWNHNSTILTKFMKGLFNTTIFTKI